MVIVDNIGKNKELIEKKKEKKKKLCIKIRTWRPFGKMSCSCILEKYLWNFFFYPTTPFLFSLTSLSLSLSLFPTLNNFHFFLCFCIYRIFFFSSFSGDFFLCPFHLHLSLFSSHSFPPLSLHSHCTFLRSFFFFISFFLSSRSFVSFNFFISLFSPPLLFFNFLIPLFLSLHSSFSSWFFYFFQCSLYLSPHIGSFSFFIAPPTFSLSHFYLFPLLLSSTLLSS